MGIRTRSRRSIGAVPADPGYHVGPATQQPNSCFHVRIERRLVVLRSIWSGDHRAPVAQRIERRPPEPDRLSVVAALVGPRAKPVEFYALSPPTNGGLRAGPPGWLASIYDGRGAVPECEPSLLGRRQRQLASRSPDRHHLQQPLAAALGASHADQAGSRGREAPFTGQGRRGQVRDRPAMVRTRLP